MWFLFLSKILHFANFGLQNASHFKTKAKSKKMLDKCKNICYNIGNSKDT